MKKKPINLAPYRGFLTKLYTVSVVDAAHANISVNRLLQVGVIDYDVELGCYYLTAEGRKQVEEQLGVKHE